VIVAAWVVLWYVWAGVVQVLWDNVWQVGIVIQVAKAAGTFEDQP
jgi:hypothetical protein